MTTSTSTGYARSIPTTDSRFLHCSSRRGNLCAVCIYTANRSHKREEYFLLAAFQSSIFKAPLTGVRKHSLCVVCRELCCIKALDERDNCSQPWWINSAIALTAGNHVQTIVDFRLAWRLKAAAALVDMPLWVSNAMQPCVYTKRGLGPCIGQQSIGCQRWE